MPLMLRAQGNIPLGTWRVHISYNNIKAVAPGSGVTFAAAENGVFSFYKEDRRIETLHKGNGLSNTGVSTIAYANSSGQLLIAYDDGTFDLVQNNVARYFDPSRNTVLTGTKNINHIAINNNLAYMSTDYGVLVFDLVRREIKETWRDLGPNGVTLRILSSTFRGDSIFLATASGIMAGDLGENLLDFGKWRRFNDTGINTTVQTIASFNDIVFAGINELGLFVYQGNAWIQSDLLQGKTFSQMYASAEDLLITENNNVWSLDRQGGIILKYSGATSLNDAKSDAQGRLWIGDSSQGMFSDFAGAFTNILPNGPSRNEVTDLLYYDGGIFLVSGGFSENGVPLTKPGEINVFRDGVWTSEDTGLKDLTTIHFSNEGNRYVGSFGYGVEEERSGTKTLYNENNSTLINTSPPGRNVNVTSIMSTTKGIWVANYGAVPSIHFKTTQGNWEGIPFAAPAGAYPLKLIADYRENVWMIFDPSRGGGMGFLNTSTGDQLYLNNQDMQGELPSNVVFSMAEDRDGNIWVGTDAGVAYFFDVRSDAIKPIFENRFLLRDDRVKAIAVDGGNRKWVGTERGLWLFSPTGEEAVAFFTVDNSPLLSNHVIGITINPHSGEVFIATDRGLTSFRSDASASTERFEKIKIFPNPVTDHFTGRVGISGLATDAVVKITDISGRLVWETRANGGTASWDVKDHQGNRVKTGVFLVFAVTDGGESMVGKIAVVN